MSVSVTVAPHTASVQQGRALQLTATVGGSPNLNVTWSTTGGSVSAAGVLTVPFGASTSTAITVTAMSVADPTKRDSCVVTVTASLSAAALVKSLFTDGGYLAAVNAQIAALGPLPGWRAVTDRVYPSRPLVNVALNLPALFVETRQERSTRIASGGATQTWVEIHLGLAVGATSPPLLRELLSAATDVLEQAGATVLRAKRGLTGGVVDYEFRGSDPEGEPWDTAQGGVECRIVSAVFAASVVHDV